jgi:glyoxalase family protein
MQLTGIHHLTAVTADVKKNHAFYAGALGLRLVKKTVNQDDVSAYHLFYADAKGSPGTDITFFDWPAPPELRGTHSVVGTGFRVAGEASLGWWADRFTELGVRHSARIERDGRPMLEFEDSEGQRLSLVVDPAPSSGWVPWVKTTVPPEHQIRGLGPITLSVPRIGPTGRVLTQVMNMSRLRSYKRGDAVEVHVYSMGEGGPAAEIHVAVEPSLETARQGAGGVHHVAFRTTLADYDAWAGRLGELGMPTSGPVDRFYFKSLYFREPNGILFEIATDEPGFAVDETQDAMGDRLALPPFLEGRRSEIEAGLKPLS